MRPVSARFLEALTGSHNMAVRVRAVPAGQTGVNPVSGTFLDSVGGDVQLDGSADIRSTLEVEIAPYDSVTGALLWPEGSAAPLTPYGAHELFVERGVVFGGGSVEYVSLGYFRVDDVEQPDAPDGSIRVSGSDRMANIIDAKLTDPWQFDPTETYGDVIEALVTDAYASAVIEWDDDEVASDPIGRTAIAESDRYAFLKELVTGLGKVAYFGHRGTLVIKTPPSATLPNWTVSRGAGGVLVTAGRALSRSGVYNGVLATGEALDTEPPARALVVDTDPDSPTLWGGPFGKVPREFASPLMTTDAQCAKAAATLLRKAVGLPYNVDFTAVPNPALEPDDPIAIGFEGAPLAVSRTLLVGDSFTRTVVNGIGTSESGHPWSLGAGADVNSQITAGVYRRTLPVAGNTGTELLSSAVGRRDVDLYADVQVPNVATGASLVAGLILRYSGGADSFGARIEFDVGGVVSTKLHKWLPEYEEPVAISGVATYTAGQWWSMRARAHGSTIEFKAWPRDTADEPEDWWWSYDEAHGPGVANRFGLWQWRVGGNTNASGPQWLFDNFRAYDVPATGLIGGEVHVIDTLSIPLTASGAMKGATREQTLVAIEVSD